MLVCPVELRQHGAQLEVIVDANRSSPDASSHCARSLDQHECLLRAIYLLLLLARLIELRTHENVASLIALVLGDPDLLESVRLHHLLLHVADHEVSDLRILVLVLSVFILLERDFRVANGTVFVVRQLKFCKILVW